MNLKMGFLASVSALCLMSCGTLTGIPGHGGGKRFTEEQRLVSASIRGSLEEIDVSRLKGKRAAIIFSLIADEGAGNIAGGRASLTALLTGGTMLSPVTSQNNAFEIFQLNSTGATQSTTISAGSSSNVGSVSIISTNNSTSATTGSGTSSADTSTTTSGSNSSETDLSSSTSGTTTGTSSLDTSSSSTSSGSTDTDSSSDSTTTTGSTTTNSSSTGSSETSTSGTGSSTGTNTGSTSGTNASSTESSSSTSGTNSSTGNSTTTTEDNSTSTTNTSGGDTSNQNSTNNGTNEQNTSQDQNSQGTHETVEVKGSTVQEEGDYHDVQYQLQYRGLGEYVNQAVPKSDASLLMSLTRNYFLLNNIEVTTPTDPTADVIVYVTVDVFGINRKRTDIVLYNNEHLHAETAIEMFAMDRNGNVIMRPVVGNTKASYQEDYIFWSGPFNSEIKTEDGGGLLNDFTDQ